MGDSKEGGKKTEEILIPVNNLGHQLRGIRDFNFYYFQK